VGDRSVVRWTFGATPVMLDGVATEAAPAASAAAVKGRWWRTAGTDAVLATLCACARTGARHRADVTMAAGVRF